MNSREWKCKYVLARASAQAFGIQDALNNVDALAKRMYDQGYFDDDDSDVRDILRAGKAESTRVAANRVVSELASIRQKVTKVGQEHEVMEAKAEVIALQAAIEKAHKRISELEKHLENEASTRRIAVLEGVNNYRQTVLTKLDGILRHLHNPDERMGFEKALARV